MIRIILATCVIGSLMCLNSCYYDAENYLYPNTNCDSTVGSFSLEVKPLLDKKCATCHNQQSASGGITLHNYTNIQQNSAKILASLNHEQGTSQMPKGEPKLPVCDIKKVKVWIDKGTPNN